MPNVVVRAVDGRRWGALVTSLLAVAGAGAVLAAPASAEPAPCTSAAVNTDIAATVPLLDFSENLGYDAAGDLWVSRVARNEVQRYDAAGNVTARVPVFAPGAIALGPDGLLYVAFGDLPVSLIPGGPDSGVVRFDPAASEPVPETFVSGLGMANGAAFDSDGDLYVGDTGAGVVRVRPDGTTDAGWNEQAKLFGANGVAVDDGTVYVTETAGVDGRILGFPIDRPSDRRVVATLTDEALPIPALPDDLTAGEDGNLYVATTLGKLVRVDPASGSTCELHGGEPLTAVTTGPGGDLMIGTLSGNVLRASNPK